MNVTAFRWTHQLPGFKRLQVGKSRLTDYENIEKLSLYICKLVNHGWASQSPFHFKRVVLHLSEDLQMKQSDVGCAAICPQW